MAKFDYKLEDIIDVPLLQDLQEKLNEVYSFPSAIIDNDGRILTAVAWQDICTKFHRKHPICEKECIKSDKYILKHLNEANPAVSYQCPHGLVDNATPIIIDGKHLGNFFTGQFFLEKPDLEFFRKQAEKYNFDENEYLEAVSRVPIWTKQKVDVYLDFIKGFIQMIGGVGLKNLHEKKVNIKLTEQEDRYKAILKTASDGFWLVNNQGHLLEVNDAYCAMSGFRESELLSMKISDIDILESPEIVSNHFEKIVTNGGDRFLTRHRRKDGTVFDAEVSVQYIKNNNDLFVAFLRDVSNQIRSESELVRAKEEAEAIKDRFDYATSIGRVGTWDWNLVTNDLIWSTETYRILGYEPFSIKPGYELFLDLLHPDDREYLDWNVKLAWEGKKPYSVDCRIILAGSEERICNATGKVEYDSNNKPIRMVGTFQDITDRKKTENELILAKEKIEISEEKYRALYNNAPLSYQSLDKNGNFLDVNPMWLRTLGYDRNEVIGKWYGDFLHPDHVEHFRVNFPAFKKQGHISDVQFKLRKKNGSFVHVSFEGCVGYTPEGKFRQTYCVFKDITEQKALELYLTRAKERAEESDRLKSAFLQNMSHEIRTPMNAIMGFSELLLQNFNDKAKLANFTSIINKSCSYLLEIINDILDISKIESGQLPVTNEPCNLDLLFAEIRLFFAEYQKKIGKQHIKFNLRSQYEPSPLIISADRVKLKQIFLNLIGNAFKFTDSGQIEAGYHIDDSKNIIFYISDTGIGIAEDKQEAIFERFVQLEPGRNRVYSGTGLGLSIVKGLVNLLKGKIWLESELGAGTTFYFSLPCIILQENPKESVTDEIKPIGNSHNKTILIVEDDKYNAEYIKEVLSELNVNTITVQHGKEAIDMVITKTIDLVLMDIGLPDMTGYEATRQIKQQKPLIKIIAQTAYAAPEDKRKALESGCIDYISKPLTSKMLISLINKYLWQL